MLSVKITKLVAAVAVSFYSVVMALFGVGPVAPALAASCGTGGTTWQLGNETTGLGSVQVLDTADNWNGGNSCLTIGSNGEDFTVQSQTVNTSNLLPVAFPDTNLGCEGGFCTSTTHQREPLGTTSWGSLTPKVTASWTGFDGTTSPTTEYDLLVDNEFSTDCTGDTSPTMDASVSIYLDAVKNGVHGSYTALGLADANSGPTFTDSGGKVWYTKQTVNINGLHNTEFSAKVTQTSLTNKTLHQFYNWAATHGTGYLSSSDCLRNLGAGYEPWTQLKANTLGMSGVVLDP
jgi:hypothetical protein